MDMRVSTFLRERGESCDSLAKQQNPLSNIENLGFSKLRCPFTKPGYSSPKGMIILTGPTGSGKPVRFTPVCKPWQEHVNVVTVEDPVEYFARHY